MSQTHSEPSKNEKVLFWASFMTLIAAGIGFSVRGAILKDWGQQFSFTQSELGTITGGGLIGFGLAIIFFSFCADVIGYGKLMLVAFLLHASSAVVTFAATPMFAAYGKEGAYWCLYSGMWLFALGNGTCEAVINPLTATMFRNNKTHWLNILHAGWPLGLILGAVIVLGFGQSTTPIRWEFKLGVFLVPVLLYGALMFNKVFPKSEATESGVSMGTSIITLLSPILLFLFVIHAMVGYVELGTDSWIVNITERVLQDEKKALLAFIWTNLLMFTLRFFAGPIVHQISPLGLLFFSAICGTVGLFLLGTEQYTNSTIMWIVAVSIYGVGKTFYWPTMLGVVSERFPKGGALALGICGGIGMISAGYLGGPGIGYKQDYFAVQKIQEIGKDTYERYQAKNDKGEPAYGEFPIVSKVKPDLAPPIAGIDNGKYKVISDYQGVKKDATKKTGLDDELAVIAAAKEKNLKVDEALEKSLNAQKEWWTKQGLPNEEADLKKLDEAKTFGARQALLYTAAVPATMAICYLLLLLLFKVTGGYKQETI